MSRYLIVAVLIFACCAELACQSYTKGLEQSVTRADETAAIAALHSIASAQRTYSITNNGGYGTFAQLVQAGALDSRFNGDRPKFKGYVLVMTVNSKGSGEDTYMVNADPEGPGLQGRHFYSDTSGLIHVNASQPANASDRSLDQ
jgi:Tfp pilus assembly protein PilE